MISSFKKHFLPRQYHAQLEDKIRARIQREGEPYTEYAIALGTLLRHRERYNEIEQTDRLYRNMNPQCQIAISRNSVCDPEELLDEIAAYEKKMQLFRQRQRQREPASRP